MMKSILGIIFFASLTTIVDAQQDGKLLLSKDILKKLSYSFEVDQYVNEHYFPERFSNENWKYQQGDDLRWKEPSFDDNNWQNWQTNFYLDSMAGGAWQGIGWFRLKLVIESALCNQPLALVITHFGASEIYFDGKLINQYGIPDKEPEKEKTFRPFLAEPVLVAINDQREHLIAVRYSFSNAKKIFENYGVLSRIIRPYDFAGFSIHFGDAKEAVNLYHTSQRNNLTIAMITLSVLLLMAFFHLFLFWFYSRDKSNLFIAIFILVLAGQGFFKFLPSYAHLSLEGIIWANIGRTFFGCAWLPAMMVAYYSFFYKTFPKYIWLYFLWIPIWAYANLYAFSWPLPLLYLFLAFVDMMRLFIRALIRKEKFTWVIGIGVLLSQATLIIYMSPIEKSATAVLFILYFVFLAVPVAMSVFSSLRTAEANLTVEKQLDDVKRLSEQTLAQEQEKQEILAGQKEKLEIEVQQRTTQLKQSLEDLRATQSQLIQSEKMASLGELTAGIAHEIQNPLNFVNNFSEVNNELIEELKTVSGRQVENEKLKIENYSGEELLKDIQNNNEKIIFHGKRADAIVKGMLQHSRTSSGQKELTDVNALVDEYLRLAFHGLRAKDKTFNAKFGTDLDASIGKINIVPQDIGRVILNLLNNAFYAVGQRQNAEGLGYEPTVSVSTKRLHDGILISVKDNGNGIPGKNLDKIFQPFFTTKPTGQGTGLGLSLAYDIVKAHGGDIKVDTKEGEGSEFVIQLPATSNIS